MIKLNTNRVNWSPQVEELLILSILSFEIFMEVFPECCLILLTVLLELGKVNKFSCDNLSIVLHDLRELGRYLGWDFRSEETQRTILHFKSIAWDLVNHFLAFKLCQIPLPFNSERFGFASWFLLIYRTRRWVNYIENRFGIPAVGNLMNEPIYPTVYVCSSIRS